MGGLLVRSPPPVKLKPIDLMEDHSLWDDSFELEPKEDKR